MTNDSELSATLAQFSEQIRELQYEVRTLKDKQEIADLIGSYHRWCDGGWGHIEDGLVAASVGEARGTHNGDRVAELFVEDGVYTAVHPEAGQSAHFPGAHGRDEIRALVNSWRGTPWAIHYSTNPTIRVDGDVATGEFKGFMRLSLDGLYPLHVIYRGEFVRTTAGWRIKSLHWLNANPPAPEDAATD